MIWQVLNGRAHRHTFILSAMMESKWAVRDWVVDSGVSEHMATHLADFTSYAPLVPQQAVCLADNSIVEAVGVGLVNAPIINGAGQLTQQTLSRVYHVLGLLGSVLPAQVEGAGVQFKGDGAWTGFSNQQEDRGPVAMDSMSSTAQSCLGPRSARPETKVSRRGRTRGLCIKGSQD
ncbi:hypothetical protein BDV93DRAFT_250524 [Ceratobasidium sp. AG-I]|nr:hypothetical protein BDV93DRAFT_250524 [Ceratobasidium sp. AG-I]